VAEWGKKGGSVWGTLLAPRGCAGLVTRLNALPHFAASGLSSASRPSIVPGRAPDSHWSGLENKTPRENLRVSRPKSVPLMTTQWGWVPSPLPHSRFDPDGAGSRLHFSGRQSSNKLAMACQHMPLSALHGKFTISEGALLPAKIMVGVARPSLRPHHAHHVNIRPKNSRTFSMSQQARLGAGRRTPYRHDRGRVHFVGYQARPQRYWDRTVGFHG
jgi:hypothetical protein